MLTSYHRLPLIGILLSAFILRSGTAVTSMALPWLINAHTASSFWASAAISVCLVTSIFGALLGGILIDRIGPAFTTKIAGFCGASAIALVPLLSHFHMLHPFLLVSLLACTTLFDGVAASSQDSRIPELAAMAEVSLRRVVAVKSVIGYAATLSIPVAAGFAARAWGTEAILLHSSVSLLVGGIVSSLVMARVQNSNETSFRKSYSGEHVLARIIVLWHNTFLRSLIFATAGAVAIISATSGVIIPKLMGLFNGDIRNYGWFMSALSGGGILGLGLYGMLSHRFKVRSICAFAYVLIAISLLLLGTFPSTLVVIIGGILLGTAASPITSAMGVALFEHVDIQLRGRSFGIVTAIISSVSPVAVILIGYGIDKLGPQFILMLLGVIFIFTVFFIPRLINQPASAGSKSNISV